MLICVFILPNIGQETCFVKPIVAFNYSGAGMYFVTICTKDRECLFGEVVDGEMRLNPLGEIIKTEWLKTPVLRSGISLGAWVIMPNHLHGIIVVSDDAGTQPHVHALEQFSKPVSNSVPTIVRLFKSTTFRQVSVCRKMQQEPVWQRNYYGHVIGTEESLERIWNYITENPRRWAFDRDNPKGRPDGMEGDFWQEVGG